MSRRDLGTSIRRRGRTVDQVGNGTDASTGTGDA